MKKRTCDDCNAKCCRYVALEIDTPETKKDFENIKWYVCHENVNVFVDEKNVWHLEFITLCEFLDENFKCTNYENRPKICKDYNHGECTFHNEDYKEKHTFTKLKDVEDFIKEKFKNEN